MSSSDRKWSRDMFRHLRRGQYDRAMFKAVRGNPKLMQMYYEGKQETQNLWEEAPPEETPAVERRPRTILINGVTPDETGWEIIRNMENHFGNILADGFYWYDPFCGAFGIWGNATWFFLPPDLPLGGELQPNCSGPPTGVYLNGRDIHPLDLQILNAYIGYIQPGFYYLDAYGNMGMVGFPPSVNMAFLFGR